MNINRINMDIRREIKDKIYEELSFVSSTISNPKRMEILDILAQGSFSVEIHA